MVLSDCKIKNVHRDRLYYDLYTYAVSMRCQGVHYIRSWDHDHLDKMVQRRRSWSFIAADFVHSDSNINKLHELIDCVNLITVPFRKTLAYNYLSFYVNDLSVLNSVCALPYMEFLHVTRALVTKPRNQVQLRSSQFQYRTYFRDRWFKPGQGEALAGMFRSYSQVWRMCPSILNMLDSLPKTPLNGVRRHWFIDHEHPQDTLILEMAYPGITRKTLPIIADK